MNRLAPEIQIIICECLLESATNSLKQFSNPEGRDAAKDLASFDEEAQTLLNLSQASKHWRTVSHPALEQMGNMILHYGLKPAPWQIAEASDKKKKQDSSQQPGSQGSPPNGPIPERPATREEQAHLGPYIDSLLKLPSRYRSWALRMTMPTGPYMLRELHAPAVPFAVHHRSWAWFKTPIARDLLIPHMKSGTHALPWFLSSDNELKVSGWIENNGWWGSL